jgi:CIC family chloride channel protein
MPVNPRPYLTQQYDVACIKARSGWDVLREKGPGKVTFWFIALVVGIAAGFAALFFRKGINVIQAFLYGTDDVEHLHSFIGSLDWYWVVLIPTIGGLTVGVILHIFTRDARVRSVGDVILGAAMHEGRVETRAGIASALASLITLSTGGSSGREGPVVHLAGVISTLISRRINASGITGRDLLGCAVAAGVSASFNAPIAGALFALEVVLRHFAVHAFAPIVIASAAGTVINRMEFGGLTEFALPTVGDVAFYAELPAFLLLGLTCGLVAVILMRSIFWAEDIGNFIQAKSQLPRYLRPAVAGALLGFIALWYPHIIGVGYETTTRALTGNMVLNEAFVFAVLKIVAVSITLGGRMGGGVFSPSLMLGALTGLAFGLIATSVFPNVSGVTSRYALAGMGAVAAFASRIVDRSFFLTQMERRGVHLAAGPQAYLLAMFMAARVMRSRDDPGAANDDVCWELIGEGTYIDGTATLEAAMPIFEQSGRPFIPVVTLRADSPPELLGALFHVDALKAYNRALAETAAEEHS